MFRKIYQKISNEYFQGNSFKARIAQGGLWVVMGGGTQKIVRLLRNMILTRLLAPEVFGVMTIVLSINIFFELLIEIGIKKAVIQNPKGDEKEYLNGAWWLSICQSVILYIIGFFCAPLISRFYADINLEAFLRIAFLSILFNGLMSPNAYVALKRMDFKRWVYVFNGGGVFGIIFTLVLAFMIRNVWALVIGFTVGYFARTLLSHIVFPYKPGLNFNRTYLKELFKYARGIFGLPILTFLFMRIDVFVIGKLLPSRDLGLYSMASQLARMPFLFMVSILDQVIMSAFAEIQSDRIRTNKAILNTTSLIFNIGSPILVFVIFYGKELLTLIYGIQYGVVAIPFAIVCANELIRVSSAPTVTAYLARGRPELGRLFVGIRALIIIILIYPAVKWFGLTGAALSGLIAVVMSYYFQLNTLHKLTGIELGQYLVIFLKSLVMSLCIGIIWVATNKFMPSQPGIRIIPGVIGCIFAYGLTVFASSKFRMMKGKSGAESD